MLATLSTAGSSSIRFHIRKIDGELISSYPVQRDCGREHVEVLSFSGTRTTNLKSANYRMFNLRSNNNRKTPCFEVCQLGQKEAFCFQFYIR